MNDLQIKICHLQVKVHFSDKTSRESLPITPFSLRTIANKFYGNDVLHLPN